MFKKLCGTLRNENEMEGEINASAESNRQATIYECARAKFTITIKV